MNDKEALSYLGTIPENITEEAKQLFAVESEEEALFLLGIGENYTQETIELAYIKSVFEFYDGYINVPGFKLFMSYTYLRDKLNLENKPKNKLK